MQIMMDVDAALSEVPVNVMPLIDDGDFKTIEDALAYDAAGMDLRWNFVTPAGAFTSTAVTPTTGGAYDWTHQGDGMYTIEIPASGGASINNDTEGFGWFTGKATGVLPWRGPIICFRAAGLNDALIESAYSTTRGLAGTALPNAAAEASGGLPTLSAAQASNGTINVNLHRWLTGTPNALQSGRVDSYLGAAASGVLAAANFASDVFVAAAAAVWDRATSALTTVGSIGKLLVDNLDAALSSRAPAATALSTAQWTNARAGYLDNLNVGGLVASSAEVTAIQNNTRATIAVPEVIERPDAGTTTFRVEIALYDEAGNMEAPDAAPTIALVNQAGTDRSSRLDSTTMALVSTGRYRAIYTADAGDALEQLVWAFSVVEGGQTRVLVRASLVVDTTAVDFTAADRTKLEAIHTKLPSKATLAGTSNSDGDVQLDEATGGLSAAAQTTVQTAAAAALTAYDPPTRAEATSDKAEILTAVADVPTNAELETALAAADDAVLAQVALVKAKTDNLPTDPADASDLAAAFTALNAKVDAIDDFLDTEIAAIKVVTDQLVAAQAEPTAVPAANATPLQKIAWLAMMARNKQDLNKDTGAAKVYADNGSTVVGSRTDSDDGTTYTRGKVA